MLAWENFQFSGIIPSRRKKLLPKGYATIAHDVDLSHASLKSFLEPRFIKQAEETATYLYSWGCDLLTWDKCVSVAEWIPDCPRLFITGNADYPQVITKEGDDLVYRRLGVLAPPTPPIAQFSTAHGEEKDTDRSVAYMITFVNNFGEEGGASPPSNDVVIRDGEAVNLTFRYNPPFEYDIKKLRIYRRETGFRTGLEKEQTMDTYWFFLTELPIGTREWTDTMSITDIGWAYEHIDTREPPANLENITALTETAILAGSVRNKVLFSHNLEPHNWELSQELTLDDNVVAMGSLGSWLYVATDGYPYRIQADNGCDKMECRQVNKYLQPFPMINCHTGHGAVITPMGFIYATTDGLVLLSENNSTIITNDLFSQDDWRMLAPHTARLAYYKGALYCVTDKISFILWLDTNTYADTKYKKLTTISDKPIDMVVNRQGELLLLQNDRKIEQWNAGDRLRPYKWQSSSIDLGFLFDLTRLRALVLNDYTTISIISRRTKISRRFPTGDWIIPFGRQGKQREFYIEAEGIGEISEICAGLSEIDMSAREGQVSNG